MKKRIIFILVLFFVTGSAFATSVEEVFIESLKKISQQTISFDSVPGTGNENYYYWSNKDEEGYYFTEYVDSSDGLVKFEGLRAGSYRVTISSNPSEGPTMFEPSIQTVKVEEGGTAILSRAELKLKSTRLYSINVPSSGEYDRFAIVDCDMEYELQFTWFNKNDDGSLNFTFEARFDEECIRIVALNYNSELCEVSEPIIIDPLVFNGWNWQPNQDLEWSIPESVSELGTVILEGSPIFTYDGEEAVGDDISSVYLRNDIESSIVIAGSKNVPVLDIEFKALESYMLTELVIVARSGSLNGSPESVRTVTRIRGNYFYDGQNQVAEDVPVNGVVVLDVLSSIAKDNRKVLQVYADFNGDRFTDLSGKEVYFELKSYKYITEDAIEHEVEVNLMTKVKKVVHYTVPFFSVEQGDTSSLQNADNQIMDIDATVAGSFYFDVDIKSMAVEIHTHDENNDGSLLVSSVELLDEYGNVLAVGGLSVVDERNIYTFFFAGGLHISNGGGIHVFTVNVNLVGLDVDDSCGVTLLRNNFSWNDGVGENIIENTDLILGLEGTIEIEK